MIASLGIGMQALSSVMSTNTPARPGESMTSVAAVTSGSENVGWHGQGSITLAAGGPPKATVYGTLCSSAARQQFAADAVLAAAAFALAFVLRFLDVPSGIPHRYVTMLAGSVAFVAIGKAIVFEVLGLHRKWWRYFQLPDIWPVVRASRSRA